MFRDSLYDSALTTSAFDFLGTNCTVAVAELTIICMICETLGDGTDELTRVMPAELERYRQEVSLDRNGHVAVPFTRPTTRPAMHILPNMAQHWTGDCFARPCVAENSV